jgi:hypothetical protein
LGLNPKPKPLKPKNKFGEKIGIFGEESGFVVIKSVQLTCFRHSCQLLYMPL